MSMVYRAPDDIVNWTVLRPTSLEGANQLQVPQPASSSLALEPHGACWRLRLCDGCLRRGCCVMAV
jgi:hypothetical protein